MKSKVLKGMVIAGLALAAVFTVSIASVDAESVYNEYSPTAYSDTTLSVDYQYSIQEMLIYAINDEYMAQAEYSAIINAFGEVMPFVRIVEAEQTHIGLLLPLFATYGIEVPENNAADSVVIPDSITSALATGVEAEEANIAMYEAFLAQDNLPDDVRSVFESLLQASQQHLAAFSGDRHAYLATDIMNQFKYQWKKMVGGSDQTQGNGSGNQYKGANGQSGTSNGYDGVCPNA